MSATYDLRSPVLALAGVLLAAGMLACDGGEEPTGPTTGPVGVATVEVSPESAALHAIGAEQTFEATALDSAGNPVSGVTFGWRSVQTAVATVGSGGVATAEGEGTTVIEAVVGEVTGSAELQVDASVSMAARIASVDQNDPAAGNDTTEASVTVHAQ